MAQIPNLVSHFVSPDEMFKFCGFILKLNRA